MWEPDPGWTPLPGGGPGSAGLWSVDRNGARWVVKRLWAPAEDDRLAHRPEHVAYWRREAQVALTPSVVDGPGLVPPGFGTVEEDDEGVTVWAEDVAGETPNGLFVARALGRFAAAPSSPPAWAARRLLGTRIAMAEARGGWPTLARTTLADVTDRLWQRRGHWLSAADGVPLGRVHGDATPGNFLARREEDVVAVDWQCFGVGPLGSDLGYYALSSREEFDVLLEAYADGAGLDVEQVVVPARVQAVYTAITRAEWVLRQAAQGEGALAGKFRHPAVAPYVRALQRQLPQIEALL